MTMEIPQSLAMKANTFPESSYGATTVTLVLSNGTQIDRVVLAGARIVKVGDRLVSSATDLDFAPADVADVKRSGRSRLAAVWEAVRQIPKSVKPK